MTSPPESSIADADPALPWRRGGARTAAALVAACALAGTALFVGTQLGSRRPSGADSDAAAAAWTPVELLRPPAATPLLGHLRTGRLQPVIATLPTGARSLVVTAVLVRSGQTVRSGDVLAIVSGRPVIMVTSPFPFYRDLRVGDRGPDVRALQSLLQRDGSSGQAPDGVFAAGTQDALARFYARRDLTPPAGSADQVAERDQAAAALATLPPTATPVQVASARDAVNRATRAAGPWLPIGEFITVSSETAKVISPARRGAVVPDGEPLLKLSVGRASATARADALAITDYRVGTKVRVLPTGAATSLTGIVVSIGSFVEGSGTASDFPGRDVTVTFDKAPALPNGTAASIQPIAGETQQQPAVPLVALREDSRGAYVLRKAASTADKSGSERVPVQVVGQADGYALVTAPTLKAGQFIRLGG